jgi:hypothetical protein
MGVFGSKQVHKGSFKAELLKVNFGGATAGTLVQNVQFNFTQQVSMLFEVGSENVYFVGGRAQGTASVSRIVGPGKVLLAFFQNFGDICKPKSITFTAEGGCGDAAGGVNYTLAAATLVAVGAAVDAQQIVITEQLQFQFVDLDAKAGGTGGTQA